MAKATSLTPDALSLPTPSPLAATKPRAVRRHTPPTPLNDTPLQIRLPKREARAIKVAAAQADQSISEYMLTCFHAYRQKKS